MEKTDSISKYETKLHKTKKTEYVAEIVIKIEDNNSRKLNNIELIIILDRSGSMSGTYTKFFKKVMPLLLEKIDYPENKEVHFITFDSDIEYRKITKKGFINATDEYSRGGSYMAGVFEKLEKIIVDKNSSYRILTLSDGDLHDSKQTSISSYLFYNKIKGQYNINSQAIRFFSSEYADPDTLGLSSILQLNTNTKNATLTDINGNDNESTIAEKLSKLLINDGLENRILLISDKKNLKSVPWDEKSDQIKLNCGNNTYWLDDISQLKVKVNDNNPVDVKIVYEEDLNTKNYKNILDDKVKEIVTKIKILKILENDDAKNEMEMMIKYRKNK